MSDNKYKLTVVHRKGYAAQRDDICVFLNNILKFNHLTKISSERLRISVFCGFGVEILLDHKCDLEGYRMFELTKVKPRDFAYLFQSVDQRIAVNKQLARRFGNIEVVFKEALYRHKRLAVKKLKASLLEDLRRNISQSVVGS